jgi:transketolase
MNYVITRAKNSEPKEMRGVYGEMLSKMASEDPRIVVLDADLMRANGTFNYREQFPGRWIDVGVAEANMVGISAGLSATGMIPFPATFTCFAARRTFDQFFISANYAKQNVKLTGTDPGVAAAFNGGTHMSFEDIGLMRTIPQIVICEPSDPMSVRKLLPQIAYRQGSSYFRLHRKPIVPIYDESEELELGKGKVIAEGDDVSIIAAGAIMVAEAIKAAEALESRGILATVVDMHTIKPIDEELVVRLARKTGAILTAENHQVRNGLGSAVAEVLTDNYPVPQRRVGIQDEFGEVGTQEYLQKRFGLTAENLVSETEKLLSRKGSAVGA